MPRPDPKLVNFPKRFGPNRICKRFGLSSGTGTVDCRFLADQHFAIYFQYVGDVIVHERMGMGIRDQKVRFIIGLPACVIDQIALAAVSLGKHWRFA